MTGERATKKQQELFTFVKNFLVEHDYSPSYREIMTALGYKSVSTVAVHLDALISKGYLRRSDNAARSLEVAEGVTSKAPSAETKKTSDDIVKKLDELIETHTSGESSQSVDTLIRALELIDRHDDANAAKKRFDAKRGL